MIEFTDKLDIQFEASIPYRDYKYQMLKLSLKSPYYISLFILLALFCWYYSQKESTYFAGFITSIVILIIIFCVTILIVIKRGYKTYLIQEQRSYTLDNKAIHIQGKTFDSTIFWTHFVKIKETKKFFLLYQNKKAVTLLPKKPFQKEEINLFRKFIKSLPLNVEVCEKK